MTNGIVQKLWNYCNLLRDDGLSYGDYVEQLTFLLFLKMADEQTRAPYNRPNPIPKDDKGKPLDWTSLKDKDGEELDAHYKHILTELGKKPGMLGMIFRKAQNKIQDPSKLKRLIFDLIGKEQWMSLDADVKGDAYEGLLEKNAADVKGGARQYFTPRALIRAIVDVIQPRTKDNKRTGKRPFTFTIPRTRKFYFPQAKGRIVKQIEFFTDPSSNTLSLRFQDDTSLSFEFATGFAMEAHFSRWKAGNEHVLKYWPRTRWEPSF